MGDAYLVKRVVCKYCGKQLGKGMEFCADECAKNYETIIGRDNSKVKYFIGGIIIGIIVMFLGVFSNNVFAIGAGIIIDGITIIFLPLPTPETVALLGYRRSKIVGRMLGILVIIAGIWVGCF